MDGGLVERIERGTERGASALLAAAVGYAVYGLANANGIDPQLGLCAAGGGVLAYLPCWRILGRVEGGTRFALPGFAVGEFDFAEEPAELLLTDRLSAADELLLTERAVVQDELLLTDADRLDSGPANAAGGPLVLDDILAEIGPEARVVRLFDRKAMPAAPRLTPGELQHRVADHLKDGTPLFAPSNAPPHSDASQALSAALAELRRSLR